MNEQETIRNTVSKAYADMVEAGEGCCGSKVPKGVAAKTAGYGDDEIAAIPDGAVVNSFGCGNPLAFSEVQEGQVVLDLGSGAGLDLLLAARKVGPEGKVIGVDMTDEMIVRARANAEAAGHTNVEIRKGIIEDLPVESGSVDWVISNCVINLSPEKARVFQEIARVLKPGGRMLVSDIVVENPPEWIRADAALYCSCIAGAISESEYLEGLLTVGLANVEVRQRLAYDPAQLEALVESEVDEPTVASAPGARGAGCCGVAPKGDLISRASEALAGKVWSASFSARKPG